MSELTQAEQDFFATGELPPELLAEAAPEVEVPAPQLETPPVAELEIQQPAPANEMVEMLRRSLAEEQQRHAEATARLSTLERQLQEKLQPSIQAPDPETDPLGNMMHQLQQVNANVADLQQKLTQEQQNNLLKQQFEQFTKSVQDMKAVYEKTVPDFADAYSHIRNVRMEDLRSVGVNEADIPKILLQDELNISQAAIQRGKNPAEEMYNMAKRYGYASKAAHIAPDQKLANIAKGQQAARQPQRSSPESELTIEGVKDASDSDLNKMVQDDKLWAKLIGGSTKDIF
jgi:hypothetical protein